MIAIHVHMRPWSDEEWAEIEHLAREVRQWRDAARTTHDYGRRRVFNYRAQLGEQHLRALSVYRVGDLAAPKVAT